jgi:4-amino-4-deoxy-L-arabinose transferase-like glycosyltransferase
VSGPRPLDLRTASGDAARPALAARFVRFWFVVPIVLALALVSIRACTHDTQRSRLVRVASEPADPPNTTAYVGFLHNPRGGPVVLGFDSAGPSRLEIAKAQFVTGQGVRKQRILLDAKPIPIRFVAAPGARLVWSPVGRRGDPEYIPPGVLSARDTPGSSSGDRFLADGIVALSLLLLLVGSILFAQRRRLALVPKDTWIAIGAIFIAGLVARLIDIGGQGQTWDEDVNWGAGRNYIQNLLGAQFDDRSWNWNYEHPPIMKYLAGIGAQFSSGFGPSRVISAILVALGCALLVPIGKRLFDQRTGIVAAGIATLLPPMVAHGQVVGHEAPTVLWWSLGVLLSLCVHDDLPSRRTLIARLAGVGVVIGIAVSSRFVNGLLGPLCVLILILRAPVTWRRATIYWSPVMIVATVVTFWAVWPRLWLHPLLALGKSLRKLDTAHAVEPFLGAITNTPPPYYFLVYLAVTLPLGVLLAFVLGLVRGAIESSRSTVILVGWLAIPLLVAASPVRQDGVRYVMPALLAISMCAASGITWLAVTIKWRHAFVAFATAITLYLAITLVRVHPYYLDYFGEHVGGAETVARNRWFETAWWGEGLDRAVDYVNTHARINARVDRSCILPQHLAWFRTDLWTPMALHPKGAEWIVEYVSPTPCNVPPDAKLVFQIDASGAPLARVWKRL